MDQELFVKKYPFLYHMASPTSHDQISKYGLLSSTAILEFLSVTDEEQHRLLRSRRPCSEVIRHPVHGDFVLRDQKPIKEKLLEKCLEGLTPAEYYQLLNERVYLWASSNRLERLLNAKAYRGSDHTIFTVSSRKLTAIYGDALELSAINSGAVLFPNAPTRSKFLFVSLSEYEKHNGTRPVVEVTVKHSITNFMNYVVDCEIKRAVASSV